jgi:hypothetical protein
MLNVKAETEYNKVWGKVKSVMSCKVDKEKGKGLSTNDYTAADKEIVQNTIHITNQQIDELFIERRG